VPTRKQRRRRAKDRRHEYEYVYVDEEGNEVEVDEDEPKAERSSARNGRAKPRSSQAGPRVQPPSWRRVGKRGLIFAPLMFITVMLIDSELAWWQWLVQTAWLMAIFLPFSYFMDSFMYRRYLRRTGVTPGEKP
jgi:hypothetical protein